jgi:pyrimidine deaminase RibD-like protein
MNYKWSPAEVNQILFCNFKEPTKAIEELVTLEPCDLYGFERVTSCEQT